MTRTRDLPVCCILPQPTTLTRTPHISLYNHFNYYVKRTNYESMHCVISPFFRVFFHFRPKYSHLKYAQSVFFFRRFLVFNQLTFLYTCYNV
jgi:hypothetical protein